jgi:hypothetical protein
MDEAIDRRSLETIRIDARADGQDRPLLVRGRYLDDSDPSVCHLATELQREGVEYKIDLSRLSDRAGNCPASGSSLPSFIGSAARDTVGPVLRGTSPVDSAIDIALDTDLLFIFSEMLDSAGATPPVRVTTVSGDTVTGSIGYPTPATVSFRPQQGWKGPSAYVASLEVSAIRDVEGNRMSDTTVVLFFKTIDPNGLGHLSGRIDDEDSLALGRIYIQAARVNDGPSVVQEILDEPGPYVIRDLLPGRYALWSYRDKDGDEAYTFGHPCPISFSERFSWYADTVEVRARWETQGIDMLLKGRAE